MSPAFIGYYSGTAWSVLGACLAAATVAMVVAGRLPLPATPALVAIGTIAGLGLLALASSLWSPS
ncbi:MAG: hypothetical protein JO265_16110, partial [Acidimicrobiia bacterium]|nr:hypothetical protein [Acidimicrobiia bacterium]